MKPQILANKIELLGAIYNAETLPTAVFVNRTKGCNPNQSTAHGFRVGNESVMDKFLEGVPNNGDQGEVLNIEFHKFYEHSGWTSQIDCATHWATNGDVSELIDNCESYAEKSFEDCA